MKKNNFTFKPSPFRIYGILFLLSLFPLISLSAQTIENFIGPATGNFTVPCGVNEITVKIWGAGGGGGGTAANGGGAGGGGGAYAESTITVTPGQVFSYTTGAAGLGGSGNTQPMDGGPSSFGTIIANGGTAGSNGIGGAAGVGGTSSGGSINLSGFAGGQGTLTLGGAGGNNGLGIGAGGETTTANTNGTFGFVGGGGGGGFSSGNPKDDGGNGGSGQVQVIYNGPDAGERQTLACGVTSTTLEGNAPAAATGTWTLVSGAGVLANPNSPTSDVSGLSPGVCAVFRWTWTGGGLGCRTISDEVEVCVDNTTNCNDEPCSALDITAALGTSCTNNIYDNINATATTGMPEPGCGSYNQSGDVWFSVTIPPSGVVNAEAVNDATNGTAYYPAIAFYKGTCDNLIHQGCAFTTSTITPSVLHYTGIPGETLYIRVWDLQDNVSSSFNLCVHTTGNTIGDVQPGGAANMNTVNCGSTITFTDPGGSGDYLPNQAANYLICPSNQGEYVSITFNSFDVDFAGDQLLVMDGAIAHAPIIEALDNNPAPSLPLTITSSGQYGCLQFEFISNGDAFLGAGWDAVVSCSSTPGINNSTTFESKTNCNKEADILVCADGDYDISNDGTGAVEELNTMNGGCFGAGGEIGVQSAWFYFQVATSGELTFSFDGPNGQDYDFAIYGPDLNNQIPCPYSSGDGPIRCSYSGASNPVGVGTNPATGETATDLYEDVSGDGWVAPLQVVAGETYAMVFNIFQNGSPQPIIDLSVGGTATLDCTPNLFYVYIKEFSAIKKEDSNYLYWITEGEKDNDYFTIQRSLDGTSWEDIGEIEGAGTSEAAHFYDFEDEDFYSPLSYYRIRSTDYNEVHTYSDIRVVHRPLESGNDLFSDVFPNPAQDLINFYYLGNHKETIQIKVYNNIGQLVLSNEFNSATNSELLQLSTNSLDNGVYQIHIKQGNLQLNQSIVIMK